MPNLADIICQVFLPKVFPEMMGQLFAICLSFWDGFRIIGEFTKCSCEFVFNQVDSSTRNEAYLGSRERMYCKVPQALNEVIISFFVKSTVFVARIAIFSTNSMKLVCALCDPKSLVISVQL